MKKIYKYIGILALASFAAGCAKEELVDPNEFTGAEQGTVVAGEELTFTLSVPESADTKTVLGVKNGDTYPVYWSEGDVVTLNGTAATEFIPSDDNKTATATFKVANLASPYNFIYGGVSGTSNQVSFPSTQNYVEGSFDPAAMPMYASVNSVKENVTFSHVASLLKFSFTGTNQISSVTLTAADNSKSLAGNFTLNTTDGALTPVSGNASLVYNLGGDKQLSQTPFVFYVAVPAGTYTDGITLEILDNDSGHMRVKVMGDEETATIAAGKVREFANVVYTPTKELNLIQINSEATLQQFASRVAAGENTLNARVTADFSVSSSWTPVADYKGIFEGNSKTITGLDQPLFDVLGGVVKNLTLNSNITATDADDRNWGMFAKQLYPSIDVDDVAGLQNCIAKGSLTYTPSSALSADCQIGGLVGNNKGGAVTNCINEATVTLADNGETNSSQASVGGVVGRTQKGGDLSTQGDISDCTNKGTVVCDAKLSENLYIGGVLGYQVEKAEYISGCVNNGLVKVGATFSTTKALQLGGVIGIGKGKIESCTNGSEGTVTSEAGSTVGTYICQGGVVGRLNNDADRVYSGLTNAGNINVAAAGAASGSYIGGSVGRCDEGASLSDCTNTGGTLEYTGSTSTCPLHIGGVVGQSKGGVTSCTNATAINVGGEYTLNSSGKYLSIGGIVGRQAADVELSNNTNTAAVTFSGYATGYTALGGVVGYCDGPISGGGNSGTISFTGYNNTNNIPIGGIVARTPGSKSGDRITGVTNSGTIVINSESQTKKDFYVGAVVGHSQSGNVSATNTGKVEVVKFKCTTLYLGGVAGYNLEGNLSATNSGDMQIASLNCSYNFMAGGVAGRANGEITATNNGNIELAEVSVTSDSKNIYVGGVIGEHDSGSLTATNNGSLTISDACSVAKGDILAGGVVGYGKAPLVNCTNTGTVSNAGVLNKAGKYLDLGGVVGYNNADSPLTNCTNSGDVINTGNSAGYVCVGGVVGENGSVITKGINTGNVSNSGCAGEDYPTTLGGVTGLSYSGNLTSCSSSVGEILNTSACTTVRVGGLVGYIKASEAVVYDKCTNSSPVNVDNECTSSIAEHIIAGGLVGRSLAPVTYNECQNDGAVCVDLYSENNKGGVRAGGIFGDSGERPDPTVDADIKAYDTNCIKCINNGDVEIFLNYSAASIKVENHIAGGIGGRMDKSSESDQVGGIISECSNSGYIYIQSNRGVIGGILGQMLDGDVVDCSNTGELYYRYNKSTAHYACAGGIVANAWSGARTIDGCTNSGEVHTRSLTNSSTRSNYSGGIIGWAEENIVVSNCENTGSVICSTCTDNKNGAAMAGGIIGYKQSTSKDFNNVNRGSVTSLAVKTRAAASGGIVGAMQKGTIEACYNYGAIEAGEKSSAYNQTNATYSVGRAGSIAGFYHTSAQSPYLACEGTITKCYVGGTVQGKHTSGEIVTITAENFGGNIVGWGDDPTDCFFAGN